jgi:sigma-B regulation protein RsbU (phosphoserine phosphatase)
MAKAKKRSTIGFLTHSISDSYGRPLLAALLNAANKYDTNLICYVGNDYKVKRGYEEQGNIVYNFIDKKNVDGIIFSGGAISNYISDREFNEFCHSYGGIPKASIAVATKGVPSVLIDNYGGVIQAMDHLISFHGHKRILAVRGPKENKEAQIRFQAYLDALAKHNIDFNPDLVSDYGDFQRTYAIAFLTEYLERKGVDFDAIVTFSDPDAEGCMTVLIDKGINIPGDAALIGFNDMDKVVTYLPSPLTTIHQPIYEQAYKSFELVIEQINGKKVPEIIELKTELVIRQSCGCHSKTAIDSAVDSSITNKNTLFTIPKKQIMQATLDSGMTSDMVEKYFEKIFAAFHHNLRENNYEFITAIEAAIQILTVAQPMSFWHNFISNFRRSSLPYIADSELERKAENLWQQARIVISEILNRYQLYEMEQAFTSEARSIRQLGEQMITSFGIHEMMTTLAATLPGIGIDSCYISLYDDVKLPPEWSRLILGFKENRELPLQDENGIRFKTRELVPKGFLPEKRRYSMALLPLYIRSEQIGLVFFEASLRSALIYESLQSQLSSALKSATLLKEINKLSHAVKYSASGIFITDVQGNIEYANPTFSDQTGYSLGEISRKRMDFLFADKNPPGLIDQIWKTILAGEIWSGDLLNKKKNGEVYWVLTSISPIHHFNKVVNYVVIQEDITEHRNLEQRLADSLKKIERELETAKNVQQAILPKNLELIYSDKIQAYFKASGLIGGDIYDVKRIGLNRYAFIVADVSGHGVPAALFSFIVKNSFSRNSNPKSQPKEILSAMNADISKDIMGGNYITAFIAIFDNENMELEYSSAGHPPALVYKKSTNKIIRLYIENPFLGIMENFQYADKKIKVEAGDRVFIYSDGLIESLNKENKMYDLARVEDVILSTIDKPIRKASTYLIKNLHEFIRGTEQKDDLTFLFFEIK